MTSQTLTTHAGPAWDNSQEYPSLESPELAQELDLVAKLSRQIESLTIKVAPQVAEAATLSLAAARPTVALCQEAQRLYRDAEARIENADVYINCELSVDGRNAAAKTLQARTRVLTAKLESAINPVSQFLKLCAEEVFEAFLADPSLAVERFGLQEQRKLKVHTLSLKEEDLLIGLTVDGPAAWGTLYDNLAGSIEVALQLDGGSRTVGLAEASSLTQHADEAVRRAAFRGVQRAWEGHEEAVAGTLNALAGWRHEVYRRRSHTRPMHFLDDPLHRARISHRTLETMLGAIAEVRPRAQRALQLMARALGKPRLDPWDLFAPAPDRSGSKGGLTKPTFGEALHIITQAYDAVSPEMGAFVRLMQERRWIEGRVGPTKRPGAYCTEFPRSRTPRVYMTYAGGLRELKTLAHELGHAFHSWVLRDLPWAEVRCPMTLAETASIFGEALVDDALLRRAAPAERLAFCWSAAREVETFLLNIPARFTFEKRFYERRLEATLTPAELKELMREAWAEWYGEALSEMDQMFWASKLHFSIAGLSFYNFPYSFGYLFALGVYAQKERLGADFFKSYVALLRDTGRMSAEEVARRHLGQDLEQPDFWRQSLEIALKAVDRLAEALGNRHDLLEY